MKAKKYSEATLDLVWKEITVEKRTLKQVAKDLDTTTDVINKIYLAAYKLWGTNTRKNKRGVNDLTPKIERPAAVYTNKQFNSYE